MTHTKLLFVAAAVAAAGESAMAMRCDVTEVKTNIASCNSFISDDVPLSTVLRGWCYLATSACILF